MLDDTFGAAWDPYCAAAQPAGSAWRCFHAQYWPAATTVGAVPTLFLEYLYDLANVCAFSDAASGLSLLLLGLDLGFDPRVALSSLRVPGPPSFGPVLMCRFAHTVRSCLV